MNKTLSLLGGFPFRTAAASSRMTYEVSLIKKSVNYHPNDGRIAVFEYSWLYTGIIIAASPEAAVIEALYEYFTEHLICRWSMKKAQLSTESLLDIDLWADDLVQSTLRRAGKPSQVIYFAADPWEPELLTLGFEWNT